MILLTMYNDVTDLDSTPEVHTGLWLAQLEIQVPVTWRTANSISAGYNEKNSLFWEAWAKGMRDLLSGKSLSLWG